MHPTTIQSARERTMRIEPMMKCLMITLLCSLCLIGTAALAVETPIKIGLLEDSTGDFAAAGIPKVHGVELAVAEINAHGGVLGRKLEIIYYDTQSDNRRYQEFARRVIYQDKVDVLFGAFSLSLIHI